MKVASRAAVRSPIDSQDVVIALSGKVHDFNCSGVVNLELASRPETILCGTVFTVTICTKAARSITCARSILHCPWEGTGWWRWWRWRWWWRWRSRRAVWRGRSRLASKHHWFWNLCLRLIPVHQSEIGHCAPCCLEASSIAPVRAP